MKLSDSYTDWKPPVTYASASTLVASSQCLRDGVISGFLNPGGSTIHTDFGSALGEACALIAEHWESGSDVYFDKALDACLSFPAEASEGNKNWRSLWRAVLTFCQLWEHQYGRGWRFESAERNQRLDITGENPYHIAGSQDLTLLNILTGRKKVIDLKAVKTSYFYSWTYNIQALIYTLLDACSSSPTQIYERPEFWVYETEGGADRSEAFQVYVLDGQVLTSLLKSIPSLARNLCAAAEKLRGQPPEKVVAFIDQLPANYKACKSGNFKCFQHRYCHEGLEVIPGGRTIYDTPEIYSLTPDELTVMLETLAVNIVDGYDASTVGSASDLGFATILDTEIELPDELFESHIPSKFSHLFQG